METRYHFNIHTCKAYISAVIVVIFLTHGFAAFPQTPATFKICTFNIQNFGKKKLADSLVVHELAGIIRRYDIVAVQEISDAAGIVPGKFRDIINSIGEKRYAVACSERTGRQADDRTSQEQYAFYYDSVKFSLVNGPLLYDDSIHDYFAREPFTARFASKAGKFTFVLITVHTTPEKAVEEIGSLDEVVKWSKIKYARETEMIVLGDFNASCSYASPAELDKLAIRGHDYYWVVPDDAKTNLSAKSNCAYDRFVLTLPARAYYAGRWGVDSSYTTKAISDHWPVWAEFKLSK